MSHKKIFVLPSLLLAAAVILAACSSAATPTEAPIVATPTQAPPTAIPTVDPSIAIMPIFDASGHADAAAEAFIHWDAET